MVVTSVSFGICSHVAAAADRTVPYSCVPVCAEHVCWSRSSWQQPTPRVANVKQNVLHVSSSTEDPPKPLIGVASSTFPGLHNRPNINDSQETDWASVAPTVTDVAVDVDRELVVACIEVEIGGAVVVGIATQLPHFAGHVR